MIMNVDEKSIGDQHIQKSINKNGRHTHTQIYIDGLIIAVGLEFIFG